MIEISNNLFKKITTIKKDQSNKILYNNHVNHIEV